jgi:hypothetical protein
MRQEYLEYAEAQLAKAEKVAEKWRAAVNAYKEAIAAGIVHPPPEEPLSRRQRVNHLISEAINRIPGGTEFTADTVFKDFLQPGLDRDKSKISISYRLSQMEKNGELKRVGWGIYVKP